MCRVRAAVLFEHGETPRPEDFDDPPDADDCVVVDVRAAGLHHLDVHKASGTFYMGPSELPRAVGNVAVQVAKVLGAGRVVAAALADDRLQGLLDRGADAIVELEAAEDLG